MKRILIVIFVLVSISVANWSKRTSIREIPDTPGADSYKISGNYLVTRADSIDMFALYYPFRLKSDNTVETTDFYSYDKLNTLGEWRIKGDTLLIYQLYLYWEYEDYSAPWDSLPLDMLGEENSFDTCYDFRNFLSGLGQRGIADESYGINVAVFRIHDNGDTITGIDSRYPLVGFSVSKDIVSNCGSMGPSELNNMMHPIVPEESSRRREPRYFWLDTLAWKPRAWHQSSNLVGKVESVEAVEGKTHRLRLNVSGVEFILVNPTLFESYVRQTEAVRREAEDISAWLSKSKEGDVLTLDGLYRVDNTDSVFYWTDVKPSLDTIFVMDSEVKGYWIATPDNHSR